MRTSIMLMAALFLYLGTSAQSVPMAVYAELGGPGIMSANFDTRFTKNEDGIGGRIGVGGFVINDDYDGRLSLLTIPVGVNYLIGKDGKNYFEVGAGYTYVNIGARSGDDNGTFESSFGNLTLGYRLAPSTGGFLFKAQITPIFNKNGFIPYYGGIGFGYKF